MVPAPPSPLPRLRSHGLSAPTGDEFRAAVRRAAGPDADAVWVRVCERVGVEPAASLLPVERLEALADALSAEPGRIGTVGIALGVRTRSYRALAARPGGDEDGERSFDPGRRTLEKLLRNRPPSDDRMSEVAGLDLFSPEARSRLDDAARRAADRFGAAIGLVSIVLEDAQYFAGSHGLSGWLAEVQGTPVEWSFCATMVRTREPYVVPDATGDVVQRANPLVENDGVAFYAGVPLVTSRGQVIGSHCIIGAPRDGFGEEDLAVLRQLADEVVALLESTRPAPAP
ncbi:GAF domain-containing protein [Kineococcus xinjiangensis]|uniref:GAF domain-containing protein n=1 Tax=Kineococcus xinjiangensis TaxID=512762 RepID=A0A2S6IHW8_9ACTN|nr:GAF domain-containing protein [Kineococcus xinjiangensis]PPK93813.1 GAF domain-containing protein [Kineococcus xinjiangensis]